MSQIMPLPLNNKKDRNKLLLAEIFSGCVTGFCVSPLNTVIDKSVIEYANKKEPTVWTAAGKSMRTLLTKPFTFLRSFEFRWMLFVYLPTYSIPNMMDHFNFTDKISHPIQKLIAAFLINTSTSLIKDMIYTKRLNPFKPVEPFPLKSFVLFFLRDMVAMAGAFTLPPIVAKDLHSLTGINMTTCQRIAQLTIPILVQIIGTPLHLLGLDIYNQKTKTFSEHLTYVRSIYFNTLALRMIRYLPAYGIGGIVNIQIRRWSKDIVPYEYYEFM